MNFQPHDKTNPEPAHTPAHYGREEQRRDYSKLTPRERAFKAIDGEREYQDEKHGKYLVGSVPVPLVDQARLAIKFADKLERVKAGPDFDAEVLGIMRELAAICVRAMEQHGAPVRA